jgi:tetratricopeptide (TPR) repeat protein
MSALQAAQRYIEIGRPQQALAALSSLDSEEAATTQAHRLRGFAFVGVEDFDRAVEEAQDGLAQDPADVGLLYLLSVAEEQRYRLEQAEAAILAALEQDPDDVELLCRYAEILMRGCELGKAERVLDLAAAGDPDSVDVLAARQSLAYLRGRDREAKRLSRELLAIDPQSVLAHRMLAVFDLNRGNAWSAASRFGEAVRADPADEIYAADAWEARRMARNPLWWPTLFFTRLGAIRSWLAAMAIIVGLGLLGLTTAAGFALIIWWMLCIWSWLVPPVLRRMGI